MNLFFRICIVAFMMIMNACLATKAKTADTNGTPKSIYTFKVKAIDGTTIALSQYKGKVLVIVNTASKCGLVDQLSEIEQLHQQYKDKGVVVLGFPANNFLGQEPLNGKEIVEFCSKNYGVTFQLFNKVSVKGDNIAPIYKFLTSQEENGVLDAPVKWNYQKFIIDRNGYVNCSISPRTSVNDEEFKQALQEVLK